MNAIAIKYLAIAAAIAALCWLSYDYGATSVQSAWNDERAALNEATASALANLNKQRSETEKSLKLKESEAWDKYNEADKLAQNLNDELTNRPWRVRIETRYFGVPKTDSTASMGNGAEQYAELSAEVTRSVIAIGKDADRCEAKLKALQDWAKIITD